MMGTFCGSYTTNAFCMICSGGFEIAIFISTGLVNIFLARSRIFTGMVAENKRFCRCLGKKEIIF